MGNAVWIEQVLSNLVQNSFRVTRNGSVQLDIEAIGKGPGGADLRFRISDTGPGCSDGKQPHAARNPDESGLELIISKKLIGFMGGALEISASPEEGSVFQFTLMLKRSNFAPTFGEESKPAADDKICRPNVRVLLVEDNKVNQKVTEMMLRKAGCIIDVAENGNDAVQAYRSGHQDIILMDCNMPGVDGYEATYRIRSMDEPLCNVPIIAVTAHALEGDKKKCIECGMSDYLSKPISKSKLIEIINRHIREADTMATERPGETRTAPQKPSHG